MKLLKAYINVNVRRCIILHLRVNLIFSAHVGAHSLWDERCVSLLSLCAGNRKVVGSNPMAGRVFLPLGPQSKMDQLICSRNCLTLIPLVSVFLDKYIC